MPCGSVITGCVSASRRSGRYRWWNSRTGCGLFLDGNTLPIHMAGAARAARGQLDPDIELDLEGVAGAVAFEALRTGLLLSIEPDPLECRLLIWNLRRLGLTKRVWPLCAGIRELSGPRAKQYWPVYT